VGRAPQLAAAFVVAVAAHVAVGVVAADLLERSRARRLPALKRGRTSVTLTLVARDPARRVSSADAPVEEREPDESIETPHLPVVRTPETREAAREEAAPRADADLEEKGVEGRFSPVGRVRPRYPIGARIRGEEGVVRVRATVNAAGSVTRVHILESSGYKSLDKAAEQAVWKARFAPEGDAPAAGGTAELSIRFRLVE
jgi:protein TonB